MEGEFSDMGSTKARLTQPFRRVLSRDPIGPGAGDVTMGAPLSSGVHNVLWFRHGQAYQGRLQVATGLTGLLYQGGAVSFFGGKPASASRKTMEVCIRLR